MHGRLRTLGVRRRHDLRKEVPAPQGRFTGHGKALVRRYGSDAPGGATAVPETSRNGQRSRICRTCDLGICRMRPSLSSYSIGPVFLSSSGLLWLASIWPSVVAMM